jgi:hypothetical protein
MLLHSIQKVDCGVGGGGGGFHTLETLVGKVGKVPSLFGYVLHIHLVPLLHQQLRGPHLPNDIS